jgi:chromate transporter
LAEEASMQTEKTPQRVPIRELVRYYLRLGLLGFGGPVALVGQMERDLVGEKKWLTKEEMREGIAVCQSLPGPLAIQVGIWISYIRGGFWGAWDGGWASFSRTSSLSRASPRSTSTSRDSRPWRRSFTA